MANRATIYVQRFSDSKEDTTGLLFFDGIFCCFTLEDQMQTVKVYGETRIPAGEYRIKLRKKGGMHERYSKRFGDSHLGMLEICDVPGFTDVLIHIGNRDDDTAGCLLVGNTLQSNKFEEAFLGQSTRAYKYLYDLVIMAMDNGRDVFIKISDKFSP